VTLPVLAVVVEKVVAWVGVVTAAFATGVLAGP
jgi:hypothetical protein